MNFFKNFSGLKEGRRIYLTLLASMGAVFLLSGTRSPILPIYVQRYTSSMAVFGVLISFTTIFSIAASFSGIISDFLGRKITILLFLALLSLSGLLLAYGTDPYILGLALIFSGLGEGAMIVTRATILDVSSAKSAAALIGVFLSVCNLLGRVVGPFVGGILEGEIGERGIFLLFSAGVIVVFLALTGFISFPESKRKIERKEFNIDAIKQKTTSAFKLCLGFAFMRGVSFAFATSFLVLYAKTVHSFSVLQVSTLLSSMGIMIVLSQFTSGFVSMAIHPKSVISGGGIVTGLSLVLIGIVTNSVWFFIIALVIAGASAAMTAPLNSMVGSLMGEFKGSGLTAMAISTSLGGIIGSIVGGKLWDLFDAGTAYISLGGVVFVSLSVISILFLKNKEEIQ
jgi:MFS family permease